MAFLLILGIAVGIFTVLILVLVGLVEMPWPILLVGLIAVIYGFQRLMTAQIEGWHSDNSLATSTRSQTVEAEANPKVNQTVYRGVKINSSPAPQEPSRVIGSSPAEPSFTAAVSPQTRDLETNRNVNQIVYRGVKITSSPLPQSPSPVAKDSDQGMVYRGIRYGDKGDSPGEVDPPNPKS